MSSASGKPAALAVTGQPGFPLAASLVAANFSRDHISARRPL